MKSIERARPHGVRIFAILFWICSAGLFPARAQPVYGFSQMHFDGTFVILGRHILDASDLGVLLKETNSNFRDLSNSFGQDYSWDSDGVRYTSNSKSLKVTWVVDPDFLHDMKGHPAHPFHGSLSILEIAIVRDMPIPEALLSQYGIQPTASQVFKTYLLKKNGWTINIITDRDRKPAAVSLEHSVTPD